MTAHFSRWRERLVVGAFAVLQVSLVADYMVFMPLGADLMKTLGLSPGQFGAINGAYNLSSALVGLTGLFWLDRVSRKTVLHLLHALYLAGLLWFALGTSWWTLVAARLIAGAAAGLLWSVALATLMDFVPSERRGRALGSVMAAYALSSMAAVPLALAAASAWGWRAPFLAFVGLGVLLLAVLLRVVAAAPPPARSEAGGGFGDLEQIPRLLPGWALTFLVAGAGFLLIPFAGAHLVGTLGVGRETLPWVYFSGGVATFAASRLVGSAVDRWTPSAVLLALLSLSMMPHLWFTQLTGATLPHAFAAFICFMALTASRSVPLLATVTRTLPGHLRGRFLAVNTAVADGAAAAAAAVGGACMTKTATGALEGFSRLGWASVALSALALGGVPLAGKRKPTPTGEATAGWEAAE